MLCPLCSLTRFEVVERKYNTLTRGMEPKRLNERTLAYAACRSYIVRKKVQDTAELVVKVVNAEARNADIRKWIIHRTRCLQRQKLKVQVEVLLFKRRARSIAAASRSHS